MQFFSFFRLLALNLLLDMSVILHVLVGEDVRCDTLSARRSFLLLTGIISCVSYFFEALYLLKDMH